MSLILVEGWGGSGKSLVLSYLDSHPQIFAMPVHDKLPYDIASLDDKYLNVDKADFRKIRGILSSHGYYNIELNAFNKYIPVMLSTDKDDTVNIPFDFNFEKFESSWKSFIPFNNKISRYQLISFFYKAFISSAIFKEKKSIELVEHYATLGDARSKPPQEILDKFSDSKIIYVRRSITELIAIRSNRKTPTSLPYGMFEKDFFELIFSGEIQKIINYERQILNTKNQSNEKVLIIDFDEIFNNKSMFINRLSTFLKISDKQLSSTMLGFAIENDSNNYSAKKNDHADRLITKNQIKLIRFFETAGRNSNFINNCFYVLM